MRASIVISAGVAALVGFGGTVAVVIAAARATGADPVQTSSWVAALCLSMAGTTAWLSLRHRLPIITAWSTPGAALLGSSAGISFEAAAGAFVLTALLLLATAALRPLAALIERIPASIAAAMLAGVLARFVTATFEQAAIVPAFVLPLVGLFLVVRLIHSMGAVLAVLCAGAPLAFALGIEGPAPEELSLSSFQFVAPTFEPSVLIGLGLPLYIVTMASQNLPGFAVLRSFGYPVPTRSILAATGLASLITAFLGAHATNLAAITAALCAGPDSHPDPAKRWMTGPFYALFYLVLTAFGASLVALFASMPAAFIATVAGVALIGPLAGALGVALGQEKERFAAALTLCVTISGASFLGIGSAFWGLAAGLAALLLDAAARRAKALRTAEADR